MNKLFEAIDNLYNSGESLILEDTALNERGGNKYLKDIPNVDKTTWSAKDKVDDRGIETNSEEREKGTRNYYSHGKLPLKKERYLYDVIKHLAPEGCNFQIQSGNNRDTYSLYLRIPDAEASEDGKTKYSSYNIADIKISIDDNDEISVEVTPDRYDQPKDFFNKTKSLKEIGEELAREKGVKFDDEFMIDNGAEIKERYSKQNSKDTLETLCSKVEKQLKKLPSSGLLHYTESEEHKIKVSIINEAWDESAPNWLKNKMSYNNSRNRDWDAPSNFTDQLKFEPIEDPNTDLRKIVTRANKDGEMIFARTKYDVYSYYNGKWRSLTDHVKATTTKELEGNIISAVVTTNRKDTVDAKSSMKDDRAEAKKGSIDRLTKDQIRDRGYYYNIDKSGYEIDTGKYTRMLKTLRAERLASSDTINNLQKENFVNRFNEIGKKAKEFISNNLDLDFNDKSSSYSGNQFNTDVVQRIQSLRSAASIAINELMNKVEQVKDGNVTSSYSGPDTTDIEGWIKGYADKVNSALDAYEKAVTKAEEAEPANESEIIKVKRTSLKEGARIIR